MTTTDARAKGKRIMDDELLRAIPELAPFDEHNESLLGHTHPLDWVNTTPRGRCNLVVIGAGTAGLVSAAGAAGLGAKVALIERKLMGGDCPNTGCVPSKALIRCARASSDARRTSQYGVEVTGEVKVDFAAIMERMRKLRTQISTHDSAARFRDLGVDVFIGDAKFCGAHKVKVDDITLDFSRAVIATGGHATAPPIPGLKEAGFPTNETLFSLTELPPRLAIIGAGPIGCEMAQTFTRLGSEVTLIEATGHILPREDSDAATIISLVLHHCEDDKRILPEAIRVTRSRLLVSESLYRTRPGQWILWAADTLFNCMRSGGSMPRALHFKRVETWRRIFFEHGSASVEEIDLSRGIHRHVLSVLDCARPESEPTTSPADLQNRAQRRRSFS